MTERRRTGTLGTYRLLKENPTELYRRIGWAPFRLRKALFRTFGTVCDPEAIHHVLVANADNYRKTPITRALLEPILGRGLLTSEGDFWRRQRRIQAPAFHHRRLRDIAALMVEETRALLARWDGAAAAGRPVDLPDEMSRVTMAIIARAMFSSSLDAAERTEVSEAIRALRNTRIRLRDLLGLPEWLPRRIPRDHRVAIRALDRIIGRLIAERRADGADRGDLLSMLLLARDAETGETMDDRTVRDEVMTIFIAGHETTATALTWTFLALDLDPEAERKLHAEVDSVLGDRAATFEDAERLAWTRMTIEETMRLYPPVPQIARQAVDPDRIGGVAVPAGAFVQANIWLAHRHPEIWPDPERFDPARFAPEAVRARPRYAYLPFGGGPRVCIGNAFALLEAQLLLASIAQRFRLRRTEPRPVVPVGTVVLRPRGGLPMRLEGRDVARAAAAQAISKM